MSTIICAVRWAACSRGWRRREIYVCVYARSARARSLGRSRPPAVRVGRAALFRVLRTARPRAQPAATERPRSMRVEIRAWIRWHALLVLVNALPARASACVRTPWLPPEDRCAVSIGCPKVFFLPKQKLIFCTIPKAASSEEWRLLRRVHNGTGTQWCHNYQSCLIHHGDPGSPEDFRHLAEALRSRFAAVVALRLPNFRAVDLSRGKDRRGGPGLVFAGSQCILQKSRESDRNI